MIPQLRDYQETFVDAITQAAADGKRRILAVLPTGAGKSVVLSSIISHAVSNGKKVLVCVHRRELLAQMRAHLEKWGVQSGMILSGEEWDNSTGVNVASIQTLHSWVIRRRKEKHPTADLVVFDECHHSISARTWHDIAALYSEAFILGVTATPISRSGKGSAAHYDAMVIGPSPRELTEAGWLVGAKYYVPTIPDLTGVRIQAGDYNEKQLAEKMDHPKLIGDIVQNWSIIAPTRRTIVYTSGVRHSMNLAEQFKAIGVKAEHVDGNTDNALRKETLERFASGDTQVICNDSILSEGYDNPAVSCVVMARPTKSILLFLQCIGRALRPSPGKTETIVIDHAGAFYEHGPIDSERDWKLEYLDQDSVARSAAAKTRVKKTITCGKCKRIYEGRLACPECGHVPTVRGKSVATYEAYLQEISELDKPKTTDPRSFYLMLRWHGLQRHYADGWAAWKYRARFGTWPGSTWKREKPLEPVKEVLAWVQSQQIAWAKSKHPVPA